MLIALCIILDESSFALMLLMAVIIHELGHLLFLKIFRYEIMQLSLSAFGLEIDYRGCLEGVEGLISIAAGPIFGLVYGLGSQMAGKEFWRMSGGISLALSMFNLIPVLPLDGGRMLLIIAGERGRDISRGISLVLFAAAAILSITKGWISLLLMGSWLLVYNLRKT